MRFLAEFILSEERFFTSFRMTLSEGLRMAEGEMLRVTGDYETNPKGS